MKNIYLCSRVAQDARKENAIVASSLREAGFKVYVPHEQLSNNDGLFNKEAIYKIDFAAMNKAELCVVVGRIGRDCAWELGWFAAKGIPICFVPCGNTDWETSPMLIPCLSNMVHIIDATKAGESLKHLLTEAA